MSQKAPAFQFYARDWLSDLNVRAMNFLEKAIYIDALAFCWLEDSLPADPAKLAAALGVKPRDLAKAWPAVGACFVLVDGRLRHRRLDEERAKQRERSEAARQSVGHRWGYGRNTNVSATVLRSQYSASAFAVRTPLTPLEGGTGGAAGGPAGPSAEPATTPTPTPTTTTRARLRKGDPAAEPEGFSAFWSAYPRQAAKPKALKAWRALAPGPELRGAIMRALADQVTWPEWVRDGGQFIPHASTWLNGKRWEDKPPAVPAPSVPVLSDRAAVLAVVRKPWVPSDCPHNPTCVSGHRCDIQRRIDQVKRGEAS